MMEQVAKHVLFGFAITNVADGNAVYPMVENGAPIFPVLGDPRAYNFRFNLLPDATLNITKADVEIVFGDQVVLYGSNDTISLARSALVKLVSRPGELFVRACASTKCGAYRCDRRRHRRAIASLPFLSHGGTWFLRVLE